MEQNQPPALLDLAPRYRQIHQELRSLIVSGKILPGERMPTEKAVSKEYSVSRHTAQHVFRLLADEGLIIRQQGSGTFVAPLREADEPSRECIRLRLGAIHPASSFIVQSQFRFARRVAELTRNQVNVEVIHSSKLGTDTEQLNMVSHGQLDMFSAASDWLEQLDPNWGVTNIPFLFRDITHVKLFVESPFARRLREDILKKCGIRVVADNWLRPSRVLVSRRPCLELQDVAGLRLRVPPIPTYLHHWKAVGAVPVEGAFHRVKQCIESGEVEAADVPRDVIYASSLHQVARYVTHTRHLYSRACIVIGEDKFRQLRPDLGRAILQAGEETGRTYSDEALEMWAREKREMIREGAVFIETNIEPFRDKTRLMAQKIFSSNSGLLELYREIFELR